MTNKQIRTFMTTKTTELGQISANFFINSLIKATQQLYILFDLCLTKEIKTKSRKKIEPLTAKKLEIDAILRQFALYVLFLLK